MPLRLFNSLTRVVEAFAPADPGHVTFYSCGPTVYDDAHIGNFRSFLAADLLRRFIESPLCELAGDARPAAARATGRRVTHVMNVTDVGHMTDDADADGSGEDKMAAASRRLAEAKKAGRLPPDAAGIDPTDQSAIARFYESRFREDARALGLKLVLEADRDPTLMPRAAESIGGMIAVIARLIERGHAYAVGPEGRRTVYFAVRSFPRYGVLSGNMLEGVRAGEGGRVQDEHQAEKAHPSDFLLWKSDPTHAMRWASPWGEGYPGWHIECTAMAAARLSGTRDVGGIVLPDGRPMIDLHSGGEDNIFPHHECEIAQSCGAFNADPLSATPEGGMFARHWFHPRFLLVEGAKMSKRAGNFHTPRDLFARGVSPAALRLALVQAHYRSNANFTMQGLKDAQRTVDRWAGFVAACERSREPGRDEGGEGVQGAFADALHDDLNLARAIAAVNTWLGTGPTPTLAHARAMRRIDEVLGVLALAPAGASSETSIGVFAPGLEPDERVVAKLEQRRDARAARDFARSDAIRDELLAMGYAIKDLPGGRVEVRRS